MAPSVYVFSTERNETGLCNLYGKIIFHESFILEVGVNAFSNDMENV